MTEVKSNIRKSSELKKHSSKDNILSSSSSNVIKSQPYLSQCYSHNEKNGNGKELQDKIFRQNERHSNGGWKFIDQPELKKQRGVCWELVKSVGNSIIEGKELTSTCLPIALFEARSFLEKVTDTWGFAPLYLQKACETNDPVERLKLVISFAISGLHLTTTIAKPFNPLLGETFEASTIDGSNAFIEQISHHPPISAWRLHEKNGRYKYTGNVCWSASCRGNIVKGYLKGPHNIEFADGSVIHFNYPDALIKGIFWGDRVTEFEGKMIFTDEKNQLGAEIIFNPNALGLIKSFFTKQKSPSDTIDGRIYRIQQQQNNKHSNNSNNNNNNYSNNSNINTTHNQHVNDGDVISKIEGSWLTQLLIDNSEYWNIKMIPFGVIYKEESETLETDSSRRLDIKHLKLGDLEKAKEYKALIEDKQRKEAKERKKENKNKQSQ